MSLTEPRTAQEEEADDLRALWRLTRRTAIALKRRWQIALAVVVLASGAVFGRLALRPARYVSRGVVQAGFHAEAATASDVRFASMANKVFETQLKLLSSERVALNAMARVQERELPPGPERDEALRRFRRHVVVSPVRDTFLVNVSAWDENAAQSAERVNAFLDGFVAVSNQFIGSRFLAEEKQAREREVQAQEAVEAARIRRESFLRKHGQIPFEARQRALEVRATELEERGAAVDIELATIAAESSRVAANLDPERFESPEVMLGRLGALGGDLEVRERILRPLRELSAQALRQEALLESTHPEVVGLRLEVEAEREALRRSIRAMSEGARIDLVQRARVHRSERRELTRVLNSLERERFALNELHAEFDQVQRDAEWYQQELERVRARQWQAEGRAKVQAAASVLDRGEIPVEPTTPFTPQTVALTLLLSLILGVFVVLVWDHLDDTLTESDPTDLDLAVLGRVPLSLGVDSERALVDDVRGLGAAGEAFRLLRTNLTFALAGLDQRVLLVTSPQPGDGKTLTAVRLAAVLAQTQGSVLLIGADLRRPRLEQILEQPSERGLAQVLAGIATLEDAVHPTDIENLHLLPAGTSPPTPGDLFARGPLAEILATARSRYSVVVIDSSPVQGMADTSLIAPHCDGVLLVARVEKTRERDLRSCLDQLSACGVRPLGLILNGVAARASYGTYGAPAPSSSDRSVAS